MDISPTDRRLVVFGILLSMFLAALDGTIVGTIMPTVIADVGGLDLYPWVATAFMLASMVVTPLYGKLSDLFGHRRFVITAIAVFLVGSALCGAAQTMPQLVLARAVQGIGAGGLLVMSFIVFGLIFSPEERGRMQGLLSSMWGISSVVGPAVGGFLVNFASWRWAFYLNVPIGIVALVLIARYLHLPRHAHAQPKIDYLGSALFAVGSIATLFALMELGQRQVTPLTLGSLAVGVTSIATFLWHERRTEDPLIPVHLFSQGTFRTSVTLGLLAGAALFSASNFLPLFVQGVLGANATVTGTVLTMISVGWVTGSTVCGQLINRLGFRLLTVAGAATLAVGFLCLAFEPSNTTPIQVGRDLILMGLGMGFVVTTTMLAVQSSVDKRQLGSATSTVQLLRSVGGTLGMSVFGGIQLGLFTKLLAEKAPSFQADPTLAKAYEQAVAHPQSILDAAARATMPPALEAALRDALGSSLHAIFWLMLAISVMALALSFAMPKGTPGQLAAAPQGE